MGSAGEWRSQVIPFTLQQTKEEQRALHLSELRLIVERDMNQSMEDDFELTAQERREQLHVVRMQRRHGFHF